MLFLLLVDLYDRWKLGEIYTCAPIDKNSGGDVKNKLTVETKKEDSVRKNLCPIGNRTKENLTHTERARWRLDSR